MQLILIRHAEPESGASYAEDALRPLTPHGREVQERVAQALQLQGISPDIVLSSPRIRAVQTAEITAQLLNPELEVKECAVLDGGYPTEALLKELQKYSPASEVICVGHIPDMNLWAAALLKGEAGEAIQFGKSSVCAISFDGLPAAGSGRLEFFRRAEMW